MTITFSARGDGTTQANPYNVLYTDQYVFTNEACYAQFWPLDERQAETARLILLVSQQVTAKTVQAFVHWGRELGMDLRCVVLANAVRKSARAGWGDDDDDKIAVGTKLDNGYQFIELQWKGTECSYRVFTMLCLMRLLTSEYVNSKIDTNNVEDVFQYPYRNGYWSADNHFPVKYEFGIHNDIPRTGENTGRIIHDFYSAYLGRTVWPTNTQMNSRMAERQSNVTKSTFVNYLKSWLSSRDTLVAYQKKYRDRVVKIEAAEQAKDEQAHGEDNIGDRPRDRRGRYVARADRKARHPERIVRAADAGIFRPRGDEPREA